MNTNSKNDIQDIGKFFVEKRTSEFYKFYYHDEEKKELINSWDQLRKFYYDVFLKQEKSDWLFRGDISVSDDKRSMKESFKTSLDKAFEEFNVKPQDRNKIENAIIRAFRRRAHLLSDEKYRNENQLEALALMRHHGAPVRILDWMYSFFPAVYFAVNKYDEREEYTVWALNRKWMKKVSESVEDEFLDDEKYLKEHLENKKEKLVYLRKNDNNLFQKFVVTYILNKNPNPLIYAAIPYRLNERLAVQRGTLLFSGILDKTWGENFKDMINESLKKWPYKEDGKEIKGPILWEITFKLSKTYRNKFLRGLDEMNINQATLFPDLDGFAESLRTRIAHPESLGVEVS